MLVTSIEQFNEAKDLLIAARSNLVNGAKKTGGLINDYATNLCVMFNKVDENGDIVVPWYELKGKAKAGLTEERECFVIDMKNAGFGTGTIDVYWQRVKEASGYVTPSNRVKGALDVDAKTIADLQTIINRIFKAEEAGDSTCSLSSDNKAGLMDIFGFMGGDIDKLG